MRALRATRSALCLLTFLAMGMGCTHVSQPHVTLHRALSPPLLALSAGEEAQPTSITLLGNLVRHSDVLFEDTPGFEVVLRDAATGDTWKLRYALPEGRRIPFPSNEEIRITLEGPALRNTPATASADTYLSLMAFNSSGDLLALVNESEALPPEQWSPWMTLRKTRELTYRETVQGGGSCLVVRDHARVEIRGSSGQGMVTLEPGTSAGIETVQGRYDFTLLDHARTTRSNCANPPADRLSFILLRP